MELDPDVLLGAYCQGLFPMAEEDGTIYWYDPDPRAILPLDALHYPRSLQRRMRQGDYVVRLDSAFREVIAGCAEPGPGRETTWISQEILEAYCRLHDLGFAHSAETWMEGGLVGGVYGVSIGGFFAGESMFSRVTDASKIALAQLVSHLVTRGFRLFDVQYLNDHLKRFGAVEIPRSDYREKLAQAIELRVTFRE